MSANYAIVPYASTQEAFDIAVRHLLTQKKRATRVRATTLISRCMYRAPDGCKCAVGALIPDDLYDPAMDEGTSAIGSVLERFEPVGALFANVDVLMLHELQDVHDNTEPHSWGRVLRITAHEYGLSTAVLDELAPQPDTRAADAALLAELQS